MAVKRWILGKMNAGSRHDPRSHTHDAARGDAPGAARMREPSVGVFEHGPGTIDEAEHLGPYAQLIGAIRSELEQFATSQLRLHLAIAERDRYLLTSIELECEGNDHERELLRRFVREFRPEQIKRYLAKEVIARLRNASAIDLSQFAGLNAEVDAGDLAREREEERYGDLIAELSSAMPGSAGNPYRVTLVGRWSEVDARAPSREDKAAPETQRTPLAARAVQVDIEDAAGTHRIDLKAIAAGRRYSVGKGEGCDIVVDGVYASRRHCEIWLENGAWRAADTGSTNGIRVESTSGVIARLPSDASSTRPAAIELPLGTWLVLSARMRGEPGQYPRLSLHLAGDLEHSSAKGAPAKAVATPVTPIAPPRRRDHAWTLTVRMGSGSRSIDIDKAALPLRIGRSRDQALVIDWAHSDVSGHHLDIVSFDESGATALVLGDNGVTVNGTFHGPGTEFRWQPGETLKLDHGTDRVIACELTLSRAGGGLVE
jgi:hypothetical protein